MLTPLPVLVQKELHAKFRDNLSIPSSQLLIFKHYRLSMKSWMGPNSKTLSVQMDEGKTKWRAHSSLMNSGRVFKKILIYFEKWKKKQDTERNKRCESINQRERYILNKTITSSPCIIEFENGEKNDGLLIIKAHGTPNGRLHSYLTNPVHNEDGLNVEKMVKCSLIKQKKIPWPISLHTEPSWWSYGK